MTFTDPIGDMLTRIRNAGKAKKEFTTMQNSKFKDAICEILKKEGYINDFEIQDARVGKELKIALKYDQNNEHAIHGIKRVSKPGLRRYSSSVELPTVLGGLGTAILSTSSGVMTQKEAKKKGCGGEVVAYVW